MLYLRVKLGNDKKFFDAAKIIHAVVNNIIKDPTEQKFLKVRLSNDKIKSAITDNEQSCFIMEMLGFERRWLEVDHFVDEFYVIDPWKIDVEDFGRLKSILDDVFK